MLSSAVKWLSNNTISRNFTSSAVRFDDGRRLTGDTHKVNNFEKKLLVWMGKYKRVEDIPAYVAPEAVERARSKMRIRVANYMMALTLVGCVFMIYSGKKARDRGESVQKYNLDWHKKYNEEKEAK
ncbi:hypothetical protein ILUMI_20669 [Ignelater luminosus]|uniref:Uncharacterized protein n=1 Tax=Ignelater luminosus TaxID=2038154 RepID=A0A8K0CDW9_IGNLU|nr:hypothetical protein ILUMI_20669 [Ignelater luminosus]